MFLNDNLDIEEEKLFISEKCHLLPKYTKDNTKFIDLFTGEELEKAYVINKKYGSYRDHTIAITHMKWLEKQSLISVKLQEEFEEMINKDFYIDYDTRLPEDRKIYALEKLILIYDPSLCLIEDHLAHDEFQKHIRFRKLWLPDSSHKLYSVDEINNKLLISTDNNSNKKRKRKNSNNNKSKLTTNNIDQQTKLLYGYRLNFENNKENNKIYQIQNDSTLYLHEDDQMPVKSIYFNSNHGAITIYLCTHDESWNHKNDPSYINPFANSLNHGSDKKFYGDTIVLSNKPIYPDGIK